MAAPTPVSSLVHSSTLVTAGVYLIIRFNYFLNNVKSIVLLMRTVTLIAAGVAAVYETDMKKLVAMSTLRQIALLAFCTTNGLWFIRLLHILFHSFFKSILFLSVGRLILEGRGIQDSRFSQKL
jgi:NADH-ubiquinone oxidoreductase chain 5